MTSPNEEKISSGTKNFKQTNKQNKIEQFLENEVSRQERSSDKHFLSINSSTFTNRLVIIQYAPPFRKGRDRSFEYTWGCLVPSLVEIGPVALEKWIFESVQCFFSVIFYFRYFVIISPREKVWPFIWRNLISLYPRMLFAKFGWNWSSFFRGGDFKCRQRIFAISLLPLLILYKQTRPFFEQTWIPFTKGILFGIWLNLAPRFWRRR